MKSVVAYSENCGNVHEIALIVTEVRFVLVKFAFGLAEVVFDWLIFLTSGLQRSCRNFNFHAFSCDFWIF